MNTFQKQLLLKDNRTQAEIFNTDVHDPEFWWFEDGKWCTFQEIELPLSEQKCTFEEFERDMKSVCK